MKYERNSIELPNPKNYPATYESISELTEDISKQLAKLGYTPFMANVVSWNADDEIFASYDFGRNTLPNLDPEIYPPFLSLNIELKKYNLYPETYYLLTYGFTVPFAFPENHYNA